MFLTPDQLVELTDRKRPKDQIAWLGQHGFRFELSAAGRPKVLLAEVERRMLGNVRTRTSSPKLDLVR